MGADISGYYTKNTLMKRLERSTLLILQNSVEATENRKHVEKSNRQNQNIASEWRAAF